MCQFCIHYFNNIRVRTQKSHITTLSRLQEVAIKKQMSNFAKNTIVSDVQFFGFCRHDTPDYTHEGFFICEITDSSNKI